jgi:hypothetical protein
MDYTDFLVECRNPKAFDDTIQQLGKAVLHQNHKGEYEKKEGYYLMRVIGDSGFLKFAIENQGYGKVIRKFEEPS